jgi:transmembrane sensor
MPDNSLRINRLFSLYLNDDIQHHEFLELIDLLQLDDKEQFLSNDLKLLWNTPQAVSYILPDEVWDKKMQFLIDELKPEENYAAPVVKFTRFKLKWAAAISGILLCTLAYIFLIKSPVAPKQDITAKGPTKSEISDVLPGGNKALLVLADGTTLTLDSADEGSLAKQGNTNLIKLSNGELAYSASGTSTGEILYNTVSTPRGGQYKITLSDGTKVWLNAASSIRFPAIFSGDKREVEVKGEVYFEVASHIGADTKNKIPFLVKILNDRGDAGIVEVLGTHFNINAYGDEPSVKTTLLEGSVKVSKGKNTVYLIPGLQSSMNESGQFDLVKNINVEEVVSWKNGKFQFINANLEVVMRQLERWYDVKVQYEGPVPAQRFGGEVPRNSNLSEVLKILEYSGVKFKIREKTILVGS